MSFTFVDLFAGIGGFHAAMSALGGRGVLASEVDPAPAKIYAENWNLEPAGDVRELAKNPALLVPDHTVLAGGFPCQPFSKSGHQRGMSELRGQMFNEILKILVEKKPPVVVLENVRNIAGPRQRPVWDAIVQGLREAGYRTPSEPCVVSPHRLSRELGGSPQTRERVYILGTYVGRDRAMEETDIAPVLGREPSPDWQPTSWSIEDDVLEPESEVPEQKDLELGDDELAWFKTWNDFLDRTRGIRLPGFPMWSKYWSTSAEIDRAAPLWKQRFEAQNINFYLENQTVIDRWLQHNPELRTYPASRQKLEWQAGDSERDLRACLLQFRPSGIRAKKPNYAPALVAITQTPIVGAKLRRLSVREAARLQAFPDWFNFGDQGNALSYKQLGNAVHTGVAYYVTRAHILQDAADIEQRPGGSELVQAARNAPEMCIVPRPSGTEVVLNPAHA